MTQFYSNSGILKIVSKLRLSYEESQTLFDLNDVILKQELMLLILRKNNFKSSESSARRANEGSSGVGKGDGTTFPDAQHMPSISFRNFNF